MVPGTFRLTVLAGGYSVRAPTGTVRAGRARLYVRWPNPVRDLWTENSFYTLREDRVSPLRRLGRRAARLRGVAHCRRCGPRVPGMIKPAQASAACNRASVSGDSEERMARPRNCDSSLGTRSGWTLRMSRNGAEVLGLR